ncbi:regulatory-associated protein of mTOR-like isoform X2 [Oscarella lobularis]|uniref:regulatory-associated protein of mTOR-like isoform X2 n=1 Tax=Oscarella lobularis TaxID=121494 RepID=UPI003313AB23
MAAHRFGTFECDLAADDTDDADDVETESELEWRLPLCFVQRRHFEPIEAPKELLYSWRMKERMKTVSVALVLCLNVGVDPPDVMKPSPCARMETWIDPMSMAPQKALETIGNTLQRQYERWQPKARYKQSLDPTTDDVKKLCTSLRRNAKGERVLFHYNGHAVPKPTTNGEIWVFNKSYTQYIPLSLYDLQSWMTSPSIYVWDCNNAGLVLDSFEKFADQRTNDHRARLKAQGTYDPATMSPPLPPPAVQNYIQMAACGVNQLLPMNPELPADLFTCCLTTPIKIALRWYVLQKTNRLRPSVSLEALDKIPGRLSDRRTPLGELNWIFTAVTDTIAWNVLPRDLFQQLFRQDLLVASLFRNYLLAERIMRSYHCVPVTTPSLPETHNHPLWQSWDLSVDLCLSQLPSLLEGNSTFQFSPFFSEQLTAFQVWLALGEKERDSPEQLPIVLQVLLSQMHRQRALDLLGKFLDLGPWAVEQALSVGIFPYVLKLLQSTARELRPMLVKIWAKILAVDPTCQSDLIKDGSHRYFLAILSDPYVTPNERTMAAFVLATIVNNYPQGQELCVKGQLIALCLEQLQERQRVRRQWLAICLGRIWRNYEEAKWVGVRDRAHEKLYTLLADPHPEVRAAATFALGTFIGVVCERNDHVNAIDNSVVSKLLTTANDASRLVRQELVVALQGYVTQLEGTMSAVAALMMEEERQKEEKMKSNQSLSTVHASGEWVVVNHKDTESPVVQALNNIGIGSQTTTAAAAATAMSSSTTSSSSSPRKVHVKAEGGVAKSSSVPRSLTASSLGGGGGGRSHSPTTTIALPAVVMATSSGSSSLSSGGGSPNTGGGASSMIDPGMMRSSPLFGFHPVYVNTWKVLLSLYSDPFPDVASSSAAVVNQIRARAMNSAQPQRCRGSSVGSHSAPSSPTGRPKQLIGESSGSTIVSPELSLAGRGELNMMASAPIGRMPTSTKRGTMPSASSASALSARHSEQFSTKRTIFGRGPSLFQKKAGQTDSPAASDDIQHHQSSTQLLRHPPQEQIGVLKTDFCEWSACHFSRSTTRVPDYRDQYSDAFLEREKRFRRNAKVRKNSEPERKKADKCKLEDQILVNRTAHRPYCLRFHPYETELIVGEKSNIGIWDWEKGRRMHLFSNRSPKHSHITNLDFVNPHDKSFLLVGTDDGNVRLWKNYATAGPELVTAWRALSEKLTSSTRGSGLVLEWKQQSGRLFASGDVRYIRVWDVAKEMQVQDIATGAESCVTCLTSDEAGRSLLVAGCGDGTVRLFDHRCPSGENVVSSHVMTLKEHNSWIVKAFMQPGTDGKILTGSMHGDVKLWDPRFTESVKTIRLSSMLSTLAFHERANIFAYGSAQSSSTDDMIKIYNLNGKTLSTIRYLSGFMGNRISPTSCLVFHPYKSLLAVGSQDCILSVYTGERPKK